MGALRACVQCVLEHVHGRGPRPTAADLPPTLLLRLHGPFGTLLPQISELEEALRQIAGEGEDGEGDAEEEEEGGDDDLVARAKVSHCSGQGQGSKECCESRVSATTGLGSWGTCSTGGGSHCAWPVVQDAQCVMSGGRDAPLHFEQTVAWTLRCTCRAPHYATPPTPPAPCRLLPPGAAERWTLPRSGYVRGEGKRGPREGLPALPHVTGRQQWGGGRTLAWFQHVTLAHGGKQTAV